MIEYAIKQPKMSLYMHLACFNTTRDYTGLGFVWGINDETSQDSGS